MADIPTTRRVMVDLTEDEAGAVPAEAAPAPAPVPVLDANEEALPERAERQEDGSIRLPLRFPVTLAYRATHSDKVREELLDELTFSRLNGADLRAIAAVTNDKMIMMTLCRSSRIPERRFSLIFDRMDAADIDDAQRCIVGFLGNGRKTGR